MDAKTRFQRARACKLDLQQTHGAVLILKIGTHRRGQTPLYWHRAYEECGDEVQELGVECCYNPFANSMFSTLTHMRMYVSLIFVFLSAR